MLLVLPAQQPLTLQNLQAELARPVPAARAEAWRGWFGGNLDRGMGARVEHDADGQGRVAFAVNAGDAKTVEVARGALPPLKLTRLAPGLWAAVVPTAEGEAKTYEYRVDGAKRGDGRNYESYRMPPEMIANPAVAKGTLKEMPPHESAIYPGTTRPWWVYTPAGPAPANGYNLIVFQDGQWARGHAVPCLDNMIALGQLPPTVAVFIKPGSHAGKDGDNRAREYDVLSPEYGDMLLKEILPKVELPITADPARRAIAGESSGAICAFTAAWQKPESFGLVMSWIGTYVNIGALYPDSPGKGIGGQNYPFYIRREPKKPIRIVLQDGAQDLDNEWGNWPLANQTMKKALDYKGYDVLWVWGEGFHSGAHGRANMPRMLRWLFTGKE